MPNPFASLFDALTHLIAAALAAGHALVTRTGLPADSSLGWILAIVALVVAVRVALLPVVVHGVRLAHAGARARPHLRELQQRYAGRTDPESVRELLAARRAVNAEHGVSRLGCLPLLLQLPILFALYAVLGAVANRQPIGAMDAALVASAGSASILGVRLADRWGDALGHSAGHALVVLLLAASAAVLSYLTSGTRSCRTRCSTGCPRRSRRRNGSCLRCPPPALWWGRPPYRSGCSCTGSQTTRSPWSSRA